MKHPALNDAVIDRQPTVHQEATFVLGAYRRAYALATRDATRDTLTELVRQEQRVIELLELGLRAEREQAKAEARDRLANVACWYADSLPWRHNAETDVLKTVVEEHRALEVGR